MVKEILKLIVEKKKIILKNEYEIRDIKNAHRQKEFDKMMEKYKKIDYIDYDDYKNLRRKIYENNEIELKVMEETHKRELKELIEKQELEMKNLKVEHTIKIKSLKEKEDIEKKAIIENYKIARKKNQENRKTEKCLKWDTRRKNQNKSKFFLKFYYIF